MSKGKQDKKNKNHKEKFELICIWFDKKNCTVYLIRECPE